MPQPITAGEFISGLTDASKKRLLGAIKKRHYNSSILHKPNRETEMNNSLSIGLVLSHWAFYSKSDVLDVQIQCHSATAGLRN